MKKMRIIRPEHIHPDGVQICDCAEQKLGFHGATPTVQRSGKVQEKLVSNLTAQATTADIAEKIKRLTLLVNELRDALVEKGIIKGSD